MDACCSDGVQLIYSCSGQSDVGAVADRAVRKLRDDGFANMACLAGVGADISGFVQSAKGAGSAITVDGCPVACARKTLETIGVNPLSYVLTEMGLTKGETQITDALITDVAEKIKSGATVKPVVAKTSGQCGCGGNC